MATDPTPTAVNTLGLALLHLIPEENAQILFYAVPEGDGLFSASLFVRYANVPALRQEPVTEDVFNQVARLWEEGFGEAMLPRSWQVVELALIGENFDLAFRPLEAAGEDPEPRSAWMSRQLETRFPGLPVQYRTEGFDLPRAA